MSSQHIFPKILMLIRYTHHILSIIRSSDSRKQCCKRSLWGKVQGSSRSHHQIDKLLLEQSNQMLLCNFLLWLNRGLFRLISLLWSRFLIIKILYMRLIGRFVWVECCESQWLLLEFHESHPLLMNPLKWR